MDYRRRLRELREDRDLSQTALGRVLNKSQQGYSHIENGRAELKIEDLIRLCLFYGVSADYVIGLTEQKTQGAGCGAANSQQIMKSPRKDGKSG